MEEHARSWSRGQRRHKTIGFVDVQQAKKCTQLLDGRGFPGAQPYRFLLHFVSPDLRECALFQQLQKMNDGNIASLYRMELLRLMLTRNSSLPQLLRQR